MKNIILIGMPGSGKTTLGKKAAEQLGMQFIDTDVIVTDKYGDITSIFKEKGEETFRRYESEVLKDSLLNSDTIIATGGGIIVKEENKKRIKEHYVIFIDRGPEAIINNIDRKSRPLLSEGSTKKLIYDLYEKRYNKYIKAMNFHVRNEGSLENPLNYIVKIVEEIRGH